MKIIIFFISIISILFLNCNNNLKTKTSILNKKKIILDNNNGGLILPDSFGALVVADSVGLTRHIAVNSDGNIFVKLRITTGDSGNMVLQDIDGDGKMDIFKRFGNYPNDGSFATEMRIHKGYIYFSSEQVVYRQKLSNINIASEKPEILVIDHHPIQWHNAKSLAFDNYGGMYVTFSAPTNACEDWDHFYSIDGTSTAGVKSLNPCPQLLDQAGIWRFDDSKLNQNQTDGVLYATGLRSVVAISWNSLDSSLYAVIHGRDYLNAHAPQIYSPLQNANLPAEEFVKIKKNDNFGWPYCYYDPFKNKRIISPEYGGDGKKIASGFTNPIMGLPAHWAPNDLLFYTGNQFPQRYKNGAFIAFHGSTNRSPYPQGGYIVAFIPFKNGKPMNKWEVFADGFAGIDTIKKMEDAKFRPMGLAEGPDGSLYISESKKGRIWRIMYKGDAKKFNEKNLLKMEKLKTKSYLTNLH